MSVRQSLLAILDQGPCYGYQLRAEFDRRTGSAWPLNVGQIYNTLERLERDGLVARGETDAQGHVYWAITESGSAEVSDWLASPVQRGAAVRDELAIKLALAATLPRAEIADVIRAQRESCLARLYDLQDPLDDPASPDTADGLAGALVRDALVSAVEADLRLLARVEERLARHPRHALRLELDRERPKRGRPARSAVV